MESIWEKTCKGPARPPLYGKAQADVAVIGGGMTGILTALELQERGLQVVVAEAGHVGGGQTGRTTAKLTAQHGAIYAGLIERLGREKAAMYARANRRAVERCCARIELEHIDCDLERADSWLYSYDREDALLREAEAERALGLDASFEPDTPLPLRVCGGVRLRGQAQFHPLKFLQALADRLTIYERTPVEHVEGGTLFTPRGTIEAGRVVFASHYPFVNVPGLYFARMHQERSYAIALENAVLPAGMYYGLEPNAWSLRSYRGTVILSGGAHRTGRNGGGHYAALREAAQALFAEAEAQDVNGFIITSGYRSRARQQEIYDETPAGYAALPGQSEHETGLCFDVTNFFFCDFSSFDIFSFFTSSLYNCLSSAYRLSC